MKKGRIEKLFIHESWREIQSQGHEKSRSDQCPISKSVQGQIQD